MISREFQFGINGVLQILLGAHFGRLKYFGEAITNERSTKGFFGRWLSNAIELTGLLTPALARAHIYVSFQSDAKNFQPRSFDRVYMGQAETVLNSAWPCKRLLACFSVTPLKDLSNRCWQFLVYISISSCLLNKVPGRCGKSRTRFLIDRSSTVARRGWSWGRSECRTLIST